jgi:hypothetical protein
VFVDPNETDPTYRVCLWAAPGQGKSVAAASAPGPILVVSADRPSAYRFARKHHHGKRIEEVRYVDDGTLVAVYRLLTANPGEFKTVVLDPFSNIYDHLADHGPARSDGEPNYQWVNKKILGFVKSLRTLDINVVLVAHERLSEGKGGDGKLYPALGGPALLNKTLAEMDIVAHIERHVTGEGENADIKWIGQIQPRGNIVCKDSTGALGDRRIADLSRWFEVANEALAPDDSDLPFGEGPEAEGEAEPASDDDDSAGEAEAQLDADEARAEAA